MKSIKDVGIAGWGVYFPKYRIKCSNIGKVWGFPPQYSDGLRVYEKTVANIDEDAITMGWEAARYAVARAKIDPKEIEAIYVGTESKPYAVKPSITVIAEALDITPKTLGADLEFACRAASEAMEASIGLISSGMIKYSLIIGSDTAQASPGDVLEFTASSGAAAFILSLRSKNIAAYFEGSYSYITDTPDFWRRSLAQYPMHGEQFTGDPAYFAHIISAVKGLMGELGLKPSDFDYVVFHQPNGRFPLKAAARLGFPKEKVLPGLITSMIGNTYNGSALIGLAAVLEVANPGQRILLVPFGSGAGSDAYSIIVEEGVKEKIHLAPTVKELLEDKEYVDYTYYSKYRGLISKFNF
ncbi:MAG: hydroxymethylglutaryl-CoA synthase [Thermoprotei archaeon]|nr:MAG: hydroxymethylglutaryl-CoA synthase [Thermoprotei archaeon]